MKVKTAELTGQLLAVAVGMAEGYSVEIYRLGDEMDVPETLERKG